MSRWFTRNAPGAAVPWLDRVAVRGEEERLLASHSAVLQIRPPLGSGHVRRTERGESVLREAVFTGRRVAWDILEACVAEPQVID